MSQWQQRRVLPRHSAPLLDLSHPSEARVLRVCPGASTRVSTAPGTPGPDLPSPPSLPSPLRA
eukprot:1677915-Rhodomonas_salina.2